jgi:hypothetical protein
MNGTPLEVLQKLGGGSQITMVLRYAHVSPGYLAGFAENASRWHKTGIPELKGAEDIDANTLKVLVGRRGLEPRTNGLRVRCSTS